MGVGRTVTTRLTQRESVCPNAEPTTTVSILRLHHESCEVASTRFAPDAWAVRDKLYHWADEAKTEKNPVTINDCAPEVH